MAVLDQLAEKIRDDEKARGERLAAGGAVTVQYSGADNLTAVVQAQTARYRTTLEWDEPELSYSCTCATHRSSGEVCAHIVATALVAESQGHLPNGNGDPKETRPRAGGVTRPMRWLSQTGQMRRVGEEEPRPAIEHRPSQPSWKKQLAKVRESGGSANAQQSPPTDWPAERQVVYIVDVAASYEARSLVVKLAARDRRQSGEWSRPKTRGISFPEVTALKSEEDRQIIALLKGGALRPEMQISYDPSYAVPEAMRPLVVPMMCRTGRVFLRPDPESDDLHELAWDEGKPWEFWLEARKDDVNHQYIFTGTLRRGEERMPVSRPLLIVSGGLMFTQQHATTFDDLGGYAWVPLLRQHRVINVPFAQSNELLGELLTMRTLPRLDLPEELRVEEVSRTPHPQLRVRAPAKEEFRPERLRAELSFDYDGLVVRADFQPSKTVFQSDRRRIVVRDEAAEHAAADRLLKLGLREAFDHSRGAREFWFGQRHLARIVRILAKEGWHVEAEGKLYRRAGNLRLNVSSGIDWFELRGDVDFGGQSVQLPALLAAMRRGETTIRLDDGTLGVVPEEWLKRYGLLASIGEEDEDVLKFKMNQAGMLDVLLAAQPEATWDETFDRTRNELRRFDGIEPKDPPPEFIGELRPYQREGLGWFHFLRRFGFGGCLADDMGLGKTVQVLALLQERRLVPTENQKAEKKNPSIVVVPKSLVFNWRQEATKFTPGLRILDHTGIDRARQGQHLLDYDLIITTYGTLRRDIEFMKDVNFDYVILDEAQAVKNPSSESAKAVRLIRGNHRLALSGTPVQNHLGDLWSLFDFLNPGMLGGASVFNSTQSSLRNPDVETRTMLASALRPFILRRTKEQVAKELPPKMEQTLYCELDAAQRKLYDELREHYRRSLIERIDREGLNKSKMQILEALLRLRQAALHPALIDPARSGESSAKLDVLLPRLAEVIDEGHKALVFSQFTSMLSIVREQLDREKIPYEYLDGKTTDRQQRVERFQNDANCKLFLISLKAGGLGLNLTSADYVFLLDPWWNPAVEAQAIDRTHRIGQTKQVYACRLIAKDTVEEKVLALQQSKRDLADAIISEENSVIRTLGREDLELLLS